MKGPANNGTPVAPVAKPLEGEERKSINPELWYACAGPLVNLPPARSLVVYFPQGHSEQVAATMRMDADVQIPSYPNLPWKLICLLHNVSLDVDPETDEVYAQMTLQPVNTNDKETFLASDLALKSDRPQTEFFCKTLTASDTSTHGGFSVPRRAAEKIFPPLDFSIQPPAQELQARDLHGNVWTFRHVFRGQPKRHLLTTGWSLFVSGKRLFSGDSVLFVRDEKQQLLVGIRRANRQPTNVTSSVLSSDSMQIGVLAAAAHAYANNSPFRVFYNPRASPSEFIIPLAKYNKAIYSNQITLGMRFRMLFETEESGARRYMGTITNISDLDPIRWKNSKWRNIQVGWDESVAGERQNRVSMWEIEPVQSPFFICPPPFFMSEHPRQPGMPDDESADIDNIFKRAMPWLGDEICIMDAQTQNAAISGLSLVQWMNWQKASLANSALQPNHIQPQSGPVLQNYVATDLSRQLGLQAQILQQNSTTFNVQKSLQQIQQVGHLPKLSVSDQQAAFTVNQNELQEMNLQQRQQLIVNQSFASQQFSLNQNQNNILHPQTLVQKQVQVQPSRIQSRLPQPTGILLNQPQQQQPQREQLQHSLHQPLQQPSRTLGQFSHQKSQQLQLPEHQISLMLLQRLQQQQQSLLSQPLVQQSEVPEQQLMLLEATRHLSSAYSLSHQDITTQQSSKDTSASMQFSQSTQHLSQQKLQHSQGIPNEMPDTVLPQPSINVLSTGSSCLLNSGGTQSLVTEDVPSCSTSPSTNNCSILPQTIMNKAHGIRCDTEVSQSAVTILSPGSYEALAANVDVTNDRQKPDTKPSVPILKPQSQGTVPPRTYISNIGQMEYLDRPSSAASVCVSQTDAQLQQSHFNPLVLFRDASEESNVLASVARNNVVFGANVDGQLGLPMANDPLLTSISLGKDYQNHLTSNNMVSSYDGSKEGQTELSSSIVSQSFGVPDMAFSSVDSNLDDSGLLNKCAWAPPPQLRRMRTYTKLYKRGAVGRSIDITRYSGYDELKQDIAQMFGIEGQLEDQQRIGWKLVYVDQENDVLLVGDDPWEEFVRCVRSIKILSPQEVQQISLDGALGGSDVPPNQGCSSSDCGNAWRGGCDQNSGNYDQLG